MTDTDTANSSSSSSASSLQLSPLDAEHQALGARMMPFAGWSMPIQYAGVMPEHRAVRDTVGVFDISHMGQLWVEGADAAAWLNGVLTNDVSVLAPGQGQYTFLLNGSGGVIDDLLIYRTAAEQFLLVVNASRIAVDVAHLRGLMSGQVGLRDVSKEVGAIAVQGPESESVFAKMVAAAGWSDAILPERNGIVSYGEGDGQFAVCRTGYTGEDGFELFCPAQQTSDWWRRALAAGAVPCGLGARDTLRLEKCYPLNGSDLNEQNSPLQAGLGFFVAMEKGEFVGRSALAEQKREGVGVKLVALKALEKGPPPRPGYQVFDRGSEECVGELTSGTQSPVLGAGIAMAYVPARLATVGTGMEIDVRGRRFPVEVVKKPFVKAAG